MEKPPMLETYDGTTDPDEHLEHLDTVQDYYQAWRATKCRLFELTLKGYFLLTTDSFKICYCIFERWNNEDSNVAYVAIDPLLASFEGGMTSF
ncbi:hypothetical protein P8452_57675 [Trifolium repens]|nr:hypothetical protein P8452_57675 [Trifolium repens]